MMKLLLLHSFQTILPLLFLIGTLLLTRTYAQPSCNLEKCQTDDEGHHDNNVTPSCCRQQSVSSTQLQPNENDTDDNVKESRVIQSFQPYESVNPKAGELSLLKWNDTGEIIDPFAAVVGLPNKLVSTIQAYAKRLRIVQGLKHVVYNDPVEPLDGRSYKTNNPHKRVFPYTRTRDELFWFAQRPAKHWSSDIHWFAGKDEYTHESIIQMLVEGGIYQVLDAIGNHYELDNLFIRSAGFSAISYCDKRFMHTDFEDVDGKYFHLLIPISAPENAGPELILAGRRTQNNKTALVGTRVKHKPDRGVLIGDSTLHSSHECDHRPDGVRVSLTIKLAEVTEENVDAIASYTSTFFPVPGAVDWLWTQKGRHWRKEQCMDTDYGRMRLEQRDELETCSKVAEQGMCENDPQRTRRLCPESCNVYMDDLEYVSGVNRRYIMGEFDFVV